MTVYIKDSGVIKQPGNIYVRASTVASTTSPSIYSDPDWRLVRKIFVNQSGTWTQTYPTPGTQVLSSGSGTFTVPQGIYQLTVSYPTDSGIVTVPYTASPKQAISYSIGSVGSVSTFGTITVPASGIPSPWYATGNEAPGAWGGFISTYGIWQGGIYSAGPYTYTVTLNFPTDGTYTFYFSVDNVGTFYIDGAGILSGNSNFGGVTGTSAFVPAGLHTISIYGYNQGGPAAIAGQILNPDATQLWSTTSGGQTPCTFTITW